MISSFLRCDWHASTAQDCAYITNVKAKGIPLKLIEMLNLNEVSSKLVSTKLEQENPQILAETQPEFNARTQLSNTKDIFPNFSTGTDNGQGRVRY